MEAAKKGHEENRVNTPDREPIQSQEDERTRLSESLAQPGRPISQLPSGPGTKSLRQAAVLQMQRTQGNSAVMRQLMPDVQRQDETEGAGGGAGATGPTPEGTGPSEISSGSSSVRATPAGVDIDAAGNLNVVAPITNISSAAVQVDGLIRASTIIADNVVATSYTPGAGNLM